MKVLIVDDDLLQLENIEKGLDWEAIGVHMVFTANNILQAKKILNRETIQLMIADVEMPGGSGLELLRWLNEQQMKCKCIIVSSYASFEYAQEAIKLHSSQYLLKPVTNKELSEVISQVLDTIKEEDFEIFDERAKQKKYFWAEYLECSRMGNLTSEIEQWAEKLYKAEEVFHVMLIKDLSDQGKRGKENWKLDKYQIWEMAENVWEGRAVVCEAVLFYGEKQWLCIGRGDSVRPAVLLAEELCQRRKKVRVFFSGETGKSLSECLSVLNLLVDVSAKAAVDVCWLDVTEWNSRRETDFEPYFSLWKEEIKYTEDEERLSEKIVALVERESIQARMTKGVIERIRMNLIELLMIWLERQKLQQFMLFGEKEFVEKYEDSMYDLENLVLFIRWIFKKMKEYCYADMRWENVIRKIKVYIEENLGKNLTRKELADVVYLSENYVSSIFAEGTGMSIPVYVTARRMEKTKEYLRNTDWSVSQIAVKVGYTNFSYFSKVFKEYVGCTPNEYRKKK